MNQPGKSLLEKQITQLVVLPGLVGVLTAGAAIGFAKLISTVQWLALGSTDLPLHVLPNVHWLRILLVPMLGGLVVGPVLYFFAPEARGHGVPEVIEAFLLRGGRIRGRVAAVKSLASALTIGTGGSVGREGPIVHIGAAVGSVVAQQLRLPPEQMRTLAACGTAGGHRRGLQRADRRCILRARGHHRKLRDAVFRARDPRVSTRNRRLARLVRRCARVPCPALRADECIRDLDLRRSRSGLRRGRRGVHLDPPRFRATGARSRIPPLWRPAAGGLLLGALILAVPNLYGVGYATMGAALIGSIPWSGSRYSCPPSSSRPASLWPPAGPAESSCPRSTSVRSRGGSTVPASTRSFRI